MGPTRILNSTLSHSHRLVKNPLMYTENQNLFPEYRQLVTLTYKYRENVVPYSQSRRILKSEDFGVFLSTKKYYNLIRNQPTDKRDSESIQGLLKALDDVEFIHHQYISTEYNVEDKLTAQRLTQIWFAHPKQLVVVQRFVTDQALIIDDIFNTKLRLSLLTTVDITNSESTFPVTFSYCPSESKKSFKFFFDCLTYKYFKFEENIFLCRVVIDDQAISLITVLSEVLPRTILQSYN